MFSEAMSSMCSCWRRSSPWITSNISESDSASVRENRSWGADLDSWTAAVMEPPDANKWDKKEALGRDCPGPRPIWVLRGPV